MPIGSAPDFSTTLPEPFFHEATVRVSVSTPFRGSGHSQGLLQIDDAVGPRMATDTGGLRRGMPHALSRRMSPELAHSLSLSAAQ
jgi:hypothetical protein